MEEGGHSLKVSSDRLVKGEVEPMTPGLQGDYPLHHSGVAQSVTCLATDACLTADPGFTSTIPVRSHTFVEIDHKLFLRSFSSLPLIYSRRVVVSYKRKYVHELLVNRLFKPAQEKVWLGELTVPP